MADKIHLTTIPSDVLGAIFSTLHDTAHRDNPSGSSQQGGLTDKEQALYDAVVAELQVRTTENGTGETRR
jgi:hypothetical protein